MILFRKKVLLPFCVAFMISSSLNAQPKISAEVIQEFINYIESNSMSVSTYLENATDLSTFVKTLKLTHVYKILESSDNITVFAPVNEAYDQFPVDVMTELLAPKNINKLRSIVTYHIINEKLSTSEIVNKIDKNGGKQAEFATMNGLRLVAYYNENDIYIKDDNGYSIKVIEQDIRQANGIVYKIETVILPQIDNTKKVRK